MGPLHVARLLSVRLEGHPQRSGQNKGFTHKEARKVVSYYLARARGCCRAQHPQTTFQTIATSPEAHRWRCQPVVPATAAPVVLEVILKDIPELVWQVVWMAAEKVTSNKDRARRP